MPEKMPSWALLVVTSCLLLAPQNLAQVTSQGEVYGGWRSPITRKREPWEGCKVGGAQQSLILAHKHAWEDQSPTPQLFLRCLLAGLGFRASELFLSNI